MFKWWLHVVNSTNGVKNELKIASKDACYMIKYLILNECLAPLAVNS
ncbi:hypothetical protein N779_25145 [Vibrio coralliilyticus OCN008]|nr:hypothetical protein N779_25145 [Vibrio coralliilyticus OCN008]